jgi:hypothetical protein
MNIYFILLNVGAIVLILSTINDKRAALKALEPSILETLDKKFWEHGHYAFGTADQYEGERATAVNSFIFFSALKTFVAVVCIVASIYVLLR